MAIGRWPRGGGPAQDLERECGCERPRQGRVGWAFDPGLNTRRALALSHQ